MGYRPEYLAVDEVQGISDGVLAAVAKAYGARSAHECPDCESRWDQSTEDECPTCGISLDDLRARLARKVGA